MRASAQPGNHVDDTDAPVRLRERGQAAAGRQDHFAEAIQASSTPPGLLTAAQLAEHWQIPVRTIYAWAKRNAVPHYRAGRLLRFDPNEVAEHFRQAGFVVELSGDPDRPGESAFGLLTG